MEPSRLHEAVAALDPLGAAETVLALPEANRRRDVPGVLALLKRLLAHPRFAGGAWTFEEAAAAMRDVGFFLGSLRRHGHEPLAVLPGLEAPLLRLAEATDLPPRETLLHCTVWNPRGPLERSYTGLTDEYHLLESVRLATAALESAIHRTVELSEVPLASERFAPLCREVAELLKKMVDGVVYAYRFVPPPVFSNDLRPYYEPIQVKGVSYFGPGAVQMPLFLLELVLWGSALEEPGYVEFGQLYLAYVLPHLRGLHARHRGKPSLLDRALGEAEVLGRDGPQAQAGLRGLDGVFEVLLRFRAPHLGLAEAAHRASAEAAPVGSGGYAAAMLNMLLTLTRNARARLSPARSMDAPPRLA